MHSIISCYYSCATRGGRGRLLSYTFLKIGRKCPDFGKMCTDFGHLFVKFSQNVSLFGLILSALVEQFEGIWNY